LKTTAAAYEELYRKRTNRVLVTAVTSVSLEEKEYEEIRRRLESSLNKGIDMKTKVDSRLIGGIKLRIGNTFLDGSVSNRLERLRDSLV
ncbi:MAG: ATP synthase F1 subunit delta, partial [Fidelibacterota bacterium]